MSFFSKNHGNRVPGPICGDPTRGLCERACIQTKKVFDACVLQQPIEDEQITVSGFEPPFPTQPLIFVSAKSVSGGGTVNNLVITRFSDKPNFARVSGEAIIPMQVNYIDAANIAGRAFGTLTVPFDVVLFVPQDSLVAVEIDVDANVIAPIGSYLGNNVFSLTGCVNLVITVACQAELLIPTYGYCLIPKATNFNDNVCAGFFDLPMFPTALGAGVSVNTLKQTEVDCSSGTCKI